MTIYGYSISKNFNTHPNIGQLATELAIIPSFIGLTHNEESIFIEISNSDKPQLDTLLLSHLPKFNNFTVNPIQNYTQSSFYERLGGPFKYGGSSTMGLINYIEVVAYKDDDITSYDVRIYDSTNNTILVERTGLTNTVESIIDLGTISNVPVYDALLELHVKRIGGSTDSSVFVKQIIVYYNNLAVI